MLQLPLGSYQSLRGSACACWLDYAHVGNFSDIHFTPIEHSVSSATQRPPLYRTAGQVGRRFDTQWQTHDKIRIALCDLWTVSCRPSVSGELRPFLKLEERHCQFYHLAPIG
jgi:hypothetical protein